MKKLLFALVALVVTNFAIASPVTELQTDWAIANYELEGDAQVAAFDALIEKAAAAVSENPHDAGVHIWQGIIQSTYAGKAGGLGALRLVKAAKASLERAMEIDPGALSGSAYTSLGALYYQVPGWPIAFGSDKKARKYLEKALTINPDGIDSNFFYGDFLLNQKEYAAARDALRKALSAAPRPGRELADTGRRGEIEALMAKIDEKLS